MGRGGQVDSDAETERAVAVPTAADLEGKVWADRNSTTLAGERVSQELTSLLPAQNRAAWAWRRSRLVPPQAYANFLHLPQVNTNSLGPERTNKGPIGAHLVASSAHR
jgi:hypothetical protein